MSSDTIRPERQVRRFDIFTEWNRLKARERMKLPEPQARIYGLAVAKIVAGRGGGSPGTHSSHSKEKMKDLKSRARKEDTSDAWWQDFGTDIEFEDKIIHRMGENFYKHTFQPAIRQAWDEGKDYEEIRDALRSSWNEQLKSARRS
ncbi:MAG: hypothetical protein JO316_18620 [Abitibacteriaceae bacterium]|nr:hypothetical protein [Abditibacteriaceae bacterium]MBV9867376.1 hypothetical protein [Abditibacteriaceae bacterium]